MKYFAKEWYELMQRQHYTSGLKIIPDKDYSDQEIQEFYDTDLAEEVENDRRIYNTPPDYSWAEQLLAPDNFIPDNFLFENSETGELFHPETPDITKQYIEQERNERETSFSKRLPFDPTETVKCFKDCYRNMLRYAATGYPDWVRQTVDNRLLALQRMPETAYNRLQIEEMENQRTFDRVVGEASTDLDTQTIPDEIKSQLHFHDAHLLALKKVGADIELYLRKDGGWPNGTTPYIKIVFKLPISLRRAV